MVERIDRILEDLQRLITRRRHLEVDFASVASANRKYGGCATRIILVSDSNGCVFSQVSVFEGLDGVKLETRGRGYRGIMRT